MRRIYRVKITQCSLNFMWYRNRIGEEFDCELVKNGDTLFASYADTTCSYRAVDLIKSKQVFNYKLVILPNGLERHIRLSEPQYEEVERVGWILDEDAEIIDMKEGIIRESEV